MSHYYWKKFHFIAGLILVLLLTVSFAVQAEHTSRIAVIPFQSLAATGGNTVFCPLCGAGSPSGKIMDGAEKIVEEVFVDRLKESQDVKIIPSEKVQNVYKRISSGKMKKTSSGYLKKVGKELGADFLAVGYIYRYVERVGYGYSSERPASVAFEIHLVNTANGSLIWRGFFDKTQKSLLENIFDISSFFKGGAKWVTARELSELGMDDVFDTFPNLED